MPVTEEAVLSFVRSSIKSAWALELLLLVRREPQRSWRIESLVRELRGSLALVRENLKTLNEIGLIALIGDEACLYQPKTAELDDLVTGLVGLYKQKPIMVLRTIFTSPSDKIKSFSNAFLLRRSDDA